MDNSAIQRVAQALDLIYGTDTPFEQRKEAERVCEQLKEERDAPMYGIHLASAQSGLSPMARHYGLQLIEHALRHRWSGSAHSLGSGKKLTMDDGAQLRERLWELIINSCQAGSGEPQYIREKLVSVMVMLIIRMWPSRRWTDLSTQLMQLYGMSSSHQEELTNGIVGALLPKSVVSELYPNGYRMTTDMGPITQVSTGKGSKKAMVILLEPGNEDGWLLRWAMHASEVAQRMVAQGSQASDQDEALLVMLLNTISTFMDWAPVKALVVIQIVQRVANVLRVPSDLVRQHAASCLEIISRRNSAVGEDRDIILLQFAQENSGAVVAAMMQAYATTLPSAVDDMWQDSADALAVAKSLAQVCVSLVTLHWARKKCGENVLPNPGLLLELLMALSKDARYTVASLALMCWSTIIKHDTLCKVPVVISAFSTLTEHTTTSLFNVCRSAHLISEAMHGAQGIDMGINEDEVEQFDSLAELRTFLSSEIRNRLLGIVRGTCNIDPTGFIGWILPSLLPVFEQPLTDASGNRDIGQVSIVEAAFMIVDTILSTLDDYEQHALEESDMDAQTQVQAARVPCYQLCRQVVGFACDDPQLITRQLQTLPSFSFLLRPAAMDSDEARNLLFKVLQKCTSFLKFPLDAPRVRELRQVARRATATLVRIATAIPDSLMLIYPDLAQLVQSSIADAEVADTVKCYLSEFQLTLIAGATCSVPQRKELAVPIVQPITETLREFAPAFQSVQDFVSFLGLPTLDQAHAIGGSSAILGDAKAALEAARRNRHRLTHILSTLQICLNRTLDGHHHSGQNLAAVWGDYAGDLVPPILLLIRCLHALWNPAHWEHLPWHSAQAKNGLFGLLEMSHAERSSIIGVSGQKDSADASNEQHQQQGLGRQDAQLSIEQRGIQYTLTTLRDNAYRCLGRLAHLPELLDSRAIPDLANNFAGCLFADAPSMAPRHWQILLSNVVRPMLETVGNWPGRSAAMQQEQCVAAIAGFVPVWLGPLLSFTTERLDSEWHDLMVRGAVLTSKEDIAALALGGGSHAAEAGAGEAVDDDIVREKMLRDWTRAWSQTLGDLLSTISLWFPEASQIEHELMNSSRINVGTAATGDSGSRTRAGSGNNNSALGAFILGSADIFAGLLTSSLHVLQYKDTQAAKRMLSSLSPIAPSLAMVSLMPMYLPPTPAHASILQTYTSRLQKSLTKSSADACSSVFTWLSTDLVAALTAVLCDTHLIDLQDPALVLLGDLVFYSASIATRMPTHWTFRNSSGAADQPATATASSDGAAPAIVPVGDPGLVFRQTVLHSLAPVLQRSGIASGEAEQTIVQVCLEPEKEPAVQ
ncbi:ARM repeat-containing protein [Martensiomyces pterosporus]|nr:ARM repeat-containing protein [Martensiomyces pterosporus]